MKANGKNNDYISMQHGDLKLARPFVRLQSAHSWLLHEALEKQFLSAGHEVTPSSHESVRVMLL